MNPVFSGNYDAKYLFCGEAPGAEEDQYKRPLIGVSGQESYHMLEESHWIPPGTAKEIVRNLHPYYNQELHRMSISNPNFLPLDKVLDASSIFMTNVCHTRPPNNEIDRFFATKTEAKRDRIPLVNGRYPKQPIQDGIEQLRRDIEAIQPTIIIALGGTALWALTGLEGITKWRGSILTVVDGPVGNFGTKLIPTFHPADILREWPHRFIAIRDLKRAYIERQWPEVREKPKHYIIRPSYTETMEWLDEQSQPERAEEPLGADIETPWGWWNLTGHIACMGFATSRSDAICIPLMCVGDKEGYWPLDQEVEVVLAMRRLMTHRPIFFHNGTFDIMHIARHWGFLPRWTDDTMVMQHVRFPGLFGAGKTDPVTGRVDKKGSSLSLAFCASMYCEHYKMWKCVDPITEILTREGWQQLQSYQNGDKIVCMVSDEKGNLQWDECEVVHNDFTGNGIYIDATAHKCWYTPNHKVLGQAPNTRKTIYYANHIPNSFRIRTSGDYDNDGVDLDHDLIRLIVAIQADGRVVRGKHSSGVQFNLEKIRKINRLQAICGRAGVEVREQNSDSTPDRSAFYLKGEMIDQAIEMLGERKVFGNWLLTWNSQCMDVFLDEIPQWDGWYHGKSSYYSSKYKENLLWVATISHLREMTCHIMPIHDQRGNEAYKMSIKPYKYEPVHNSVITKYYSGKVSCLKTNLGFFVARYEDHIFITGNSDGKNWNQKEVPDEDSWWSYNCQDTTFMYEVFEILRAALEKENLTKQYRFMMSLSGPVLDMMIRGFPINGELLEEFRYGKKDPVTGKRAGGIISDIHDLQTWINEACGHELNTGSSTQLQKFFYNDLQVKKVIKGRGRDARPTLNIGALDVIARRYPTLGPLCYTIKDERHLSHFDENMLTARLSEEGCAETSISITGTETMRFTSTKSCFGTGLNLQNLNRMPEE